MLYYRLIEDIKIVKKADIKGLIDEIKLINKEGYELSGNIVADDKSGTGLPLQFYSATMVKYQKGISDEAF